MVSDLKGKRALKVLQNHDEQAAGAVFPEADIVFDKLHMVRLLSNALDKLRKEEHGQLVRESYATLSGSKYWWLKSPGNLTANQWRSFESLLAINLKTGRAWTLTQTFEEF